MVGNIDPPMGIISNFVMSLFFKIHSAISSPLVAAICRCRKSKLAINTSHPCELFAWLFLSSKNPFDLRHLHINIASAVFLIRSSNVRLSVFAARL